MIGHARTVVERIRNGQEKPASAGFLLSAENRPGYWRTV